MNNFSALNRELNLHNMAKDKLDLLVIGGGITGAGVALDASSRGLKVGLIEKQDFSEGTSSRSTKLIHGGLRYLKQGEIRLVQEVGKERAILYRNAPHIVKPEKMLLPMVKGGTYGKLLTSIGLWIYDRLAGVTKEERRKMLSQEEIESLEPLLRKDILKGGGLYYEYQTDDARLTIDVLKTAAIKGTIAVNYSEATSFIYQDEKVVGVEVKDILTDRRYEIKAKNIVNATGPWVDSLREKDSSLEGKRLHLTKGIHIVFPYSRLPLRHSIYFDVPDGRMIFAIPRDGTTYVGTTDTDYKGNLENPRVTTEDVDYLLDAVNNMFPEVELSSGDIVSSWAGLRPLIHEEGKSPSELSRKDEIFHSSTGLITIAGGKLTGYRKMAERVVDLVMKQLVREEGISYRSCETDKILLSGGDFFKDIEVKESEIPKKMDQFISDVYLNKENVVVSREYIEYLVSKYGTNTKSIIEMAKENEFYEDIKISPILWAELKYTVHEEMVTNIKDFLIRRSGRLFFERDRLCDIYPAILDEMAKILSWTDDEKEVNKKQFEQAYHEAVRYIPLSIN